MNSTKIVIIFLILLMLIFFIGLSLNLIDKPKIGKNSSKQKQQTAVSEYSWPKAVNNILAPFADTIVSKDLSFSNCSKRGESFVLNGKRDSCTIMVTGFSETFKKLSLKPNKSTAKLDITYRPTGDSTEKFSWPSEEQEDDTINFVIMGKKELLGQTLATIILKCTNCNNQMNVKITIE